MKRGNSSRVDHFVNVPVPEIYKYPLTDYKTMSPPASKTVMSKYEVGQHTQECTTVL